jgi:hypothetical protein
MAFKSTILLISPVQGWLTPDYLDMCGFDRAAMYRPDKMLDDTRPGFAPGK